MSTINQAYINALLSDAANRPVNSAMPFEDLTNTLAARVAETPAAFISTNFKVRRTS